MERVATGVEHLKDIRVKLLRIRDVFGKVVADCQIVSGWHFWAAYIADLLSVTVRSLCEFGLRYVEQGVFADV